MSLHLLYDPAIPLLAQNNKKKGWRPWSVIMGELFGHKMASASGEEPLSELDF